MTLKYSALIAITSVGLTAVVAGQNRSGDYSQWRGANRDGAVAAFTEPATWPDKLTQKWKVEIGLGYATPIVQRNRLYTFSRQGDNEVMSALDAETGKVVWRTAYPVSFTMQGPKSTPVLAGGKLFAIGMTGVVTAFDAATGKQLWQKPGSPIVPMFTTHSFSPLVDRGIVIFHVGGHNQGALTAFDVNTGEVKWSWNGDGPGYGSPVVAELGGTRQLVTITQGKVIGVDPATGTLLWERPFISSNFTNAVTPVIYGQTIIVSGNGGPTMAFAVAKRNNQWATETLWENADIPYRLSNSVMVGDALVGLTNRNSGQYFSVDGKTGKTNWISDPRQAGNAAIEYAGNVVFSLEDDGELVIFRGSSAAFNVVKRYTVADSETWTQPVITGNRIYVKDVSNLTLWTLN
jgi:outer membrane protein assembly factor BamB